MCCHMGINDLLCNYTIVMMPTKGMTFQNMQSSKSKSKPMIVQMWRHLGNMKKYALPASYIGYIIHWFISGSITAL